MTWKQQEDAVRSILTADDLADQVEFEPIPEGNPFQPRFRVTQPEDMRASFLGGSIMDRANALWRRRRDAIYDRNSRDETKPRILAVGDSWFHYPFGSDLMEWFEDQYALKTVAAAGDVLSRMVEAREYAPLLREVRPHFFMLSGGGNDLLGEDDRGERNIKRMVIDYSGESGDWLTQEARETIRTVVGWFEQIRADIENLGFTGKMVVHGYDYPSAPSHGPWLSRPLEEKGYLSDAAQAQVLRQLVDAFRIAIRAWAAGHPNVIHADCVGLNGRGGQWWFDEIHPTMRAYRYKILQAFRTPMDRA